MRKGILLVFLLNQFFLTSPVSSQSSSKTGPYLIYTHSSGMFATFCSVLGALNYYAQGKFAGIKIDLYDGAYFDPLVGPNWWEYFFEPIKIGNQNHRNKYTFSVYEHCLFVGHIFDMPKNEVAKLMQKYVHVKAHIVEKVNQFVNQNFHGHYVLGMHYRGTDKISEVPLIPYAEMCQPVIDIYNSLSFDDREKFIIFVATDDENFLNYVTECLAFPIVSNSFVRSNDNTALHWGNDDKYHSIYQKGEEALLDCLLLSKCNVLVRTESCLSFISERFNVNMPVKIISPAFSTH